MKVTPFTRDLLKAYREDREQARQISASFREKTKADIKPGIAGTNASIILIDDPVLRVKQ